MVGAPFLIGSAVLFLAGCVLPRPKGLDAPLTPRDPEPPDDSKAESAYFELRRLGVRSPDLDQGCSTLNYNLPGHNETISGKGDGKIQSCEVYDFIFERHTQYRQLAEGLINRHLPWDLDDHNPNTNFDEKTRDRIFQAIEIVKGQLKKQGLQESFSPFLEKLAVALFYFADYPTDPSSDFALRLNQKARYAELEKIGLGEFSQYLRKNGGLGVSEFQEDAAVEASALEALQQKKGWCTERSKILFGVFQMAGLNAQFAYFKEQEMIKYLASPGTAKDQSLADGGHMNIALEFETGRRFFDLALFNSEAAYPHPYLLGLRHFFAIDLGNRGADLISQKGLESEGKMALREALRFDKEQPLLHFNLSIAYSKENQWVKALETIEDAIRLDLVNPSYFHHQGRYLLNLEKRDEALESFQKALGLDPHLEEPRLGLALTYEAKGEIDSAILQLKTLLAKNPRHESAHYILGQLLCRQGLRSEGAFHLRKGLELSPHHTLAPSARGLLKK